MLDQNQQIFEQINKAKNILITFSKAGDGDAVGSALAMFLFLKKLDKNVEIATDIPEPDNLSILENNCQFSFLPGFEKIQNKIENLRKFIISLDISKTKINNIKYKIGENKLNFIITAKDGSFSHNDINSRAGEFEYDLIITLNTADLESLGKIYEIDVDFFYKVPIINIDHHPENEEFGQINLVALTAVSTSEIVFSLLEKYSSQMIDEDIATCLLAGIIYKTKSFKTANITPNTLLTTSQLITIGGRREEIVNKLYRSRNISTLKLWGRVLARLSSKLDNKLIWSTITHIDFIKTDSSEKDLRDIIDELIINIPQAKVIIIFYEHISEINIDKNVNFTSTADFKTIEQKTKLIVYSIKNINSMDLIKEYNPIGTKKIAQATINQGIHTAEREIIELIKQKLEELNI